MRLTPSVTPTCKKINNRIHETKQPPIRISLVNFTTSSLSQDRKIFFFFYIYLIILVDLFARSDNTVFYANQRKTLYSDTMRQASLEEP